MFCDECRDFSDVFSEATEVIHRQVEHQIRFHSLPREPSSDQFAVRMEGVENKTVCFKGKKAALHPKLASRIGSVRRIIFTSGFGHLVIPWVRNCVEG